LNLPRSPRIALVGLSDWDDFIVVDRYPALGSFAITREALGCPGGTTLNSAVSLARLGVKVSLVSMLGDDHEGHQIRELLDHEGIDSQWVATSELKATDRSLVIVSREERERTIYWTQGARLKKGDPVDIAAIFGHDLVVLDVDDMPLRRFLVDLPAHTNPSARLLGAMTYLADSGEIGAWEIALRHDILVGNERELLALTGRTTLDDALAYAQSCMPGANLRACVVSRGANGAVAATKSNRWDSPAFMVDVVDTTGAGDAFAGAIAYATVFRWDWPRAIQFANAVAALSIRRLGSQSALPTIDEVASIMNVEPATLKS
jgi:sugar/nucleoside kinase (ribokinase family)